MDKKALTTGEIAKYCGVNFRTVIRWIEKGLIESYKLPGRGDNRVTVEAFVKFLEDNNMPVPQEFSATRPDAVAQVNTSVPSDASKRILVIEDEQSMANALERALKRKGYDVELALSGVEAGTKLATFKPDLVTLDLNMPGMSGFEVLQFMKSQDQYTKIKVLLVSAAGKAEIVRAMSSGADAVLEKPFKNEELLGAVTSLL